MTRAHSPAGTRPPWRSRPSWFFQRPDDRLNTLPQPVREVPGRLLILAGRADQGQGEVRACEEVLGLLTGQALIGDDGSARRRAVGRLAGEHLPGLLTFAEELGVRQAEPGPEAA